MSRRAAHMLTGDAPIAEAAGRMGLSLQRFIELRDGLERRGFPSPDPTTGNYDLDAIEIWRRARYPHLFGLTGKPQAVDAQFGEVEQRLKSFRG